MTCNNIQDISANMCNKICSDNIPVFNTEQLNNCKIKCNEKIITELNPLDITNNFIFLNSADVAENSLEKAAKTSEELYNQKKDSMNNLINTIEKEINVNNDKCDIKLGTKWKKIIDGDNNNEFIDVNYIKFFKKYSAFGIKWKNVGTVKPNSKYVELVNGTDGSQGNTISQKSYDYLKQALTNSVKDSDNNILLEKIDLINNNLFLNDDSDILKIYPNSYIKLSDNTYCKVSNYDISNIDQELKLRFNSRDDLLDFTTNDKLQDTFSNITMDDFIINESGDVYIPSVGCSDFENTLSCININDVLSQNCFADNKNNNYIKRKDTIPYIFHNESGCISKALDFNNKTELYDIINRITFDPVIIEQLNEMMGKYEPDRYEIIKNRINELLTEEYSQYFTTNDFLNLFDINVKYWIKIDNETYNYRTLFRYNTVSKGSYDVANPGANLSKYDKIAKIISQQINENTPNNFLIKLPDSDIDDLRELFKNENKQLESILSFRHWFEIIHENGSISKVILYRPLEEHIDVREALYDNSIFNYESMNIHSGINFYADLNEGQKLIQNDKIGTYGQIGNDIGFYNNDILSDDYITNFECQSIKSNILNTSNNLFITENIKNRFDLDKYKLNELDFENLTNELNTYNINIDNLNKCIENSKTMIDLDTYTKTKEYDNINNNITNNAEINKNYNTYLSKVNKYEDSDVGCKYLSEYNNKNTCGLPGETSKICLSNDLVSDDEYDSKFAAKKDALKEYIFNTQKNYYVGKNTKFDKLTTWTAIDNYPLIGLELENDDLRDLLDEKFVNLNTLIVLSDDDLGTITLDTNIDNNTYIKSSQEGRYYVVNLEQKDCNQPDNYQLQNSENICGENKQCAYENEYTNSITNINNYDDNYCVNKFNYLEQCYSQDPSFNMGKQVDYSVCKDDQKSDPTIIDCPETEDPECPNGGYITYKIENNKYTCEKECGSCVPNTTLNISDNKCHANVGYYYDYDYEQLESTNPPTPQICPSGSYIDETGAKSVHDCKTCSDECGNDQYETAQCTSSTNRECVNLPSNSTKSQDGKDFVCEKNYFKNDGQCVKCDYQTTSESGSLECTSCPVLDTASTNTIKSYKYYDYQVPGCLELVEGNCSSQQLNTEGPQNDDNLCPKKNQQTNKLQFYAFTGEIERDQSGKPLLFYPDDTAAPSNQDDIRNKLRTIDPVTGNYIYVIGDNVEHRCVKECISCEPNEVYDETFGSCKMCDGNEVANNDGLECVKCNIRSPNTIYDYIKKNCVKCPEYYLRDFENDLCIKTDPGYYVLCDDNTNTCSQEKADVNNIVLGQINTADWNDTISEIIFDYESVLPPTNVTNNINIILSTKNIFNLTEKSAKEEDKYYKDISQNIIVFENTSTSKNIPVEKLDSIYISSSTDSNNLPDKLIMKTNIGSYYLLTHSLKEDVLSRYSTVTAWNKQIQDVEEFTTELGNHNVDNSLDSYLIFDINLNIRNEQYECPENTFVDDSTATESNGRVSGTNRNICKFYDVGFYRDIKTTESFEDYSGGDTSSLSSDTTVESFTNFENFNTRIQTSCFNNFTQDNIKTIDISESKLGADSGGNYAGCIYKCKNDGYYYNEGTPGVQDNKCEPCPIGYKCDDKQNMIPCDRNKYQNQSGQQECKTIPSDGIAITDSTSGTNIGFKIPKGKQYNKENNIISNCPENTYKNTDSEINSYNKERDISCTNCPLHTTTKQNPGNEELKDCIPDFGYNLDLDDGSVDILTGYEEDNTSIKCAQGYYLGDCDISNPKPNECTMCNGENKACILCPTGYTCAGGSVDCTANDKAIPIIKPANIDNEPVDYLIDSCWPGMKLFSEECQVCEYQTVDKNMYCINGSPNNYVTKTLSDAVKLKNNDKFTPAVFITETDNQKYNIDEITQDSEDTKNIIFKFKNNYIPSNIQAFSVDDIDDSLKSNDVPLYLYEYASGEKNVTTNKIDNATNLTQNPGINIENNTIELANEGYITDKDTEKIILNKIINNNLKFVNDEKIYLLNIIKEYKNDIINNNDTINLSYQYDLEYYDGTNYKTHTYVYRILPYPSQCDAGYETLTGLIDSCTPCPINKYNPNTGSSCEDCPQYTTTNDVTAASSKDSCILKDGYSLDESSNKIKCNSGYYFYLEECKPCTGGNYCEGGIAESGKEDSAVEMPCPQHSNSQPGADSIYKCDEALPGYTKITKNDGTFEFVKNAGVMFNDQGEVVFINGKLQCEPGYETISDTECEICEENHYSTNSECLPCTDVDNTKLVIKDCDKFADVITIDKNLIRINSINIDDIASLLQINNKVKVTDLYDYITSFNNSELNYKFLNSNTEKLYFIKIPITFESIPSVTTSIHSKITPEDFNSNLTILKGTNSFDNIIDFINSETDLLDLDILDLCYYYNTGNGIEVYLLLPLCNCIPGTYLDLDDNKCTMCGENKFQPNYNQLQCLDVPFDIVPDSYNIIKTNTYYNTDVELKQGWELKDGKSSKCSKNTYNENTNDITEQIVDNNYSDIPCSTCPSGSGTEDVGSTSIGACEPIFGYKRDEEIPNSFVFKTGYYDAPPGDTIVDCRPGYYFNTTLKECEICPAGKYCIGGIAGTEEFANFENFTNFENFSAPAIANNCPVGTYNSFTGKENVDSCLQIDSSLNKYGTKAGATSADDGFIQCPPNTKINSSSDKDTIFNCEADKYYETGETVNGDFKVKLQDFYNYDDDGNIYCIPGTIINDDDTCSEPTTNIESKQYLSGKTKGPVNCIEANSGEIELAPCDLFKNTILDNINHVSEIDHEGDISYVKCSNGYTAKYFEDLSNSDEDINLINEITELYLYQYASSRLDDLDPYWTNNETYYLNTLPSDTIELIDYAIDNNLKFDSYNLEKIKDAINDFIKNKTEDDSYSKLLLYYKDVVVYKNVENKPNKFIQRYIYGILPYCQACDSGFTSDEYGNCVACPMGTKQNTNANGEIICENCPDNEYQDETGKDSCKSFPSLADSYTKKTNGAGANIGFECGKKYVSMYENGKLTDCHQQLGHYYDNETKDTKPCPGVEVNDVDGKYYVSKLHNIYINYDESNKDSYGIGINSCKYGECNVNTYRNKDGECVEFNETKATDCEDDEIYVKGKTRNNSEDYIQYDDGIESDYGTESIYGHDNLCVPISEICQS